MVDLLQVATITIDDYEKAKKGSEYMGDVFVIFKVTTTITDFDTALRYGIRNAEVWHRYSEFDVLHQYLLHTHPSSIIPPLPEKKLNSIWTKMTTDKFDGEYLEHRKISLEKFLHRIATHPVLHDDNIFKAFLMKGEEWKEVAQSTEFNTKNEGWLKGMAASMQLKTCDPKFAELKSYADELEGRINALLKVTSTISHKQRQVYNTYKDFGKTFGDWGTIEKSLSIPLQKIGHYIDNKEGAVNVLILEEDMKFFESMREYANYAGSLRDLVRKYEILQQKIEGLESTIKERKAHLSIMNSETEPEIVDSDNPRANFSTMFKQTPVQREARRARLNAELSEAQQVLIVVAGELETFVEEATKEIDVWKKDKFVGLSKTLKMYAQLQATHAQQGLKCWDSVKTAINES